MCSRPVMAKVLPISPASVEQDADGNQSGVSGPTHPSWNIMMRSSLDESEHQLKPGSP